MTIVDVRFENTDRRDIYDNLDVNNIQRQQIIHFNNLKRLYKSEVSTLNSNQLINLKMYSDSDDYSSFWTTVDVYDKQHLRVNGALSINTLAFYNNDLEGEPLLELNLRIDTDEESEGSDGDYIGNVISEGMTKLRNVQLEQVIYFYYHFETFIAYLDEKDSALNRYLKKIRRFAKSKGLSHLQAFNHILSVDVFNEPLMTFSNRGVTDKSIYHAYFTSYTPETTIKKNIFQALTKRKRNQSIEDIINTYVKVKRSRIALPMNVERVSVPIRDEQTVEAIKQSAVVKHGIYLIRTNEFIYEVLHRVSKSAVSNDTTLLHTSAQLLEVDSHLNLEGTFLTLSEEDTKRMVTFFTTGMRAKKMGGFMFFNWSIYHSFVTNDSFMNVEVDKMSLPFIAVLNKHYNESSSKIVEQLQSLNSATLSRLTRPSEHYEQTDCLLLTNDFEQNVYWNGLPELTKHSSIEHLYATSEIKALLGLDDIKPKLHCI